MKQISKLLVLSLALLGLVSACSNDDLNPTSVLKNKNEAKGEFDNWVDKNFTQPYNISILYRYKDFETDNRYNLIPGDTVNVRAMARMFKHVWIDAYTEAMGGDSTFMKTYAPRMFQFLGSNEYNAQGSLVLGTAEGGLKITLFGLNNLDIEHIVIDSISPYPNTGAIPLDLNYWYFHTIHHEFCHILNQKKPYSDDFQTISVGQYRSIDWINVKDSTAPSLGFVSGYASSEHREDFAEMFSYYVTHSASAWEQVLKDAKEKGSAAHEQELVTKMTQVKDYFTNEWGINLDKLRSIVLRRSKEVQSFNLRKLD